MVDLRVSDLPEHRDVVLSARGLISTSSLDGVLVVVAVGIFEIDVELKVEKSTSNFSIDEGHLV